MRSFNGGASMTVYDKREEFGGKKNRGMGSRVLSSTEVYYQKFQRLPVIKGKRK